MRRWFCFLAAALFLLSPETGARASGTLLRPGSRGPQVEQLQRRLIEAGFLSGEADGVYGEQTRAAVKRLQEALSTLGYPLAADGIAGPNTLRLLEDEGTFRQLSTLGPGTAGPRVAALQERLIDLNFLSGRSDGRYGPETAAAVAAFQAYMASRGAPALNVTGILDPQTRDLLFSDLSGTGIEAPPFFDDARPLSLSEAWLYSPACVLADARDGSLLFEKEADRRMFPASTTKIMTLIVALESGLPLDGTVRLPKETAQVPEDSSLVPVYPGEEMPFEDLLYALMIRSGNDAANAVAVLCRGSLEAFAAEMNLLAAQLGMQGSHFSNPHGYHREDHYTTAADLARLAVYALGDARFLEISSALSHTLPPTGRRGPLLIRNGTELLDPASNAYYPGAFGIKKGFTSAAGFCYVGAARRGDRTLVAVVLGNRDRFRAFKDLARLFNYGFALPELP